MNYETVIQEMQYKAKQFYMVVNNVRTEYDAYIKQADSLDKYLDEIMKKKEHYPIDVVNAKKWLVEVIQKLKIRNKWDQFEVNLA